MTVALVEVISNRKGGARYGTTYSVLTDDNGHYVIDHVPPGDYELRLLWADHLRSSDRFHFTGESIVLPTIDF